MGSERQPERNHSLDRLLVSFGLLNVAEWGFVTALSIYAFRAGGTLYVGLLGVRLLAGALSSAVLAPLVMGRRGVLGLITAARVLTLGCAAALTLAGAGFLIVLGVALADALVAAAYRPAQARTLPALARSPQQLTRAVAGTSIAKTVGQAAGALFGGLAVELMRPGLAIGLAATVMLLACLGSLRLAPAAVVGVRGADRPLRDGLAAIPGVLRAPDARPLVLASVLRTLVRGLWGALLVVVALRLLHDGSTGVGVIQAATALGAILALPLTATQIGRARLALPCVLAFVGAGVAVGTISAASSLALVAALVCVWGASMALADATSLSLLHRLMSTEAFSRTVAVMESLKLISEGAGALLAPALVAGLSLRAAIAVAGLPLPLLMLASWSRVRGADDVAAGRGRLVALLHRVPLLRGLDMAALEQLAAHAQPLACTAGEVVFARGEPGDSFYVIESGEAEVAIHGRGVARLGPGAEFGERALLRDTPRTATVTARSNLRLRTIGRDAFMEAVTGERGVRLAPADLTALPLEQALAKAALFSGLGAGPRARLAAVSTPVTLAAGEVAFERGDGAEHLYLLLSGRVELIDGAGLRSVLEPGDTFGELSALGGMPRLAQARALTRLQLASLPAAVALAELGERVPFTAEAEPNHGVGA